MKSVARCICVIIVMVTIVTHCYAEEMVWHGMEQIYREVILLEYSIVSTLPSPGPSPQGLAWDGTHLWVSDDSTDTIYKINPANGVVITSLSFPDANPKGLTWDGSNLWVAFGSSNTINKLNPENGEVKKTFDAVYHHQDMSAPIHGLAWDGANLWCSYLAGWSSAVIKIDVKDGSGHEWFSCDSEDITFDGNSLWHVDSQNGHSKGIVKKLLLPHGFVITYFRTPGYYPTGLTWDGTNLWLTDCETDTIDQIELLTTGVESDSSPTSFILYQNYPNPLNPETNIQFTLPDNGMVNLSIYSITGQKVRTLFSDYTTAGNHYLKWDGKDENGQSVSSGIYFARLRMGTLVTTHRMMFLK